LVMARRCDTLRQNATGGRAETYATPNLSAPQAKAIGAILSGQTVTAAAEKAGVGRATVYRWLRDDTAFLAALDAARAELLLQVRMDLSTWASQAVEHVVPYFDEERSGISRELRLKAALAILKMAGADRPEPAGPPAKRESEAGSDGAAA